MASVNKVFLLGNLTRSPETKDAGSSTVTTFGLAVNEKYNGKEETTFVDVQAWNKTGELCQQYLDKGSQVVIEGKLKYSSWDKDGQKRTKLEVVALNVQFLGKPKGDKPYENSDDIPF